jgi:phosphoribosylanthranilate isomerase
MEGRTPPRVKICGITNVDDAKRAVELGAWALGLIFHAPSPRRCADSDAERVAGALRRQVALTGVFVNAPLDEIALRSEALGLSLVQLHGDEGPAFCAEVARRTGAKVVKAVRLRSGGDLRALESYRTDYHLVDGYAANVYGGTGETVDWSLLADRRSRVPLILSGGLTPENVGEAIAMAHPFAVDTASGTEVEPGRKDPGKLEEFFAAVHATAESREHAA